MHGFCHAIENWLDERTVLCERIEEAMANHLMREHQEALEEEEE